jgi:hypothetical protein
LVAFWYVPAKQGEHPDWPEIEVKRPDGQNKQPLDPLVFEYWPAAHRAHTAEPLRGAEVPVAQGLQLDIPGSEANWPTGQAWHAEAPLNGANRPVGHWVQDVVALPRLNEPAGQAEQLAVGDPDPDALTLLTKNPLGHASSVGTGTGVLLLHPVRIPIRTASRGFG